MTTSAIATLPTGTDASAGGKLVKAANGEYTAASVAADETDARKLGLVKQKDGNYAATSASAANGSPEATTSSAVLDALSSLKRGG